MRLSSKVLVSVLSLLAITTGGSAFAENLFSFAYSDLDGDYDAASMLFTAADDDNTNGDVTRIISPGSTAFFSGNAGDGGFPDFASFSLETTLANITPTTADLVPGLAFLNLTDVDGSRISADLSGQWTNVGGSAHFNGLLTNVRITAHDGSFDGTDGSSFSTVFPVDPPFNGNIINLTFGAWFLDDPEGFENLTTLTSGVVVPEPATLALFAVGGLALVVRRRRK
ncbi:MAG: PEP-CTERM sorting domain-containing protein [Planctomycetes bacterium]|nr:PEP-CTERM sorting domain-containing protein [Planctomycetota bacterium]